MRPFFPKERERKELSKIEIAEENGSHGNRKEKGKKKCMYISINKLVWC